MKITKMHGSGNDYVYLDAFTESVENAPRLARRLADRHFGVGGDGLIIIRPPEGGGADCRMEMYNADGSRAQMCGNGIRCVGKYVFDHGLVRKTRLVVETDAGPRDLELHPGAGRNAKIEKVTVDMGRPAFAQSALPSHVPGAPADRVVDTPIEVPELGTVVVTLVSMGNPHCVVRLTRDQPIAGPLESLDLQRVGPLFEHHPAFPERINTEFITLRGPTEIDLRVWERGSGETLACGTGACAAVAAGVIAGWNDRRSIVHLRGGDLEIHYDQTSDRVFMTGEATEVFSAELSPRWLSRTSRESPASTR